MFKNTFHSSYQYISLFYSLGSEPLQLWNKVCSSEGCIDFVIDEQLQSKVLEIRSNQINENYIVSPSRIPTKTLAITLPILVFVVKNVRRFFQLSCIQKNPSKTSKKFILLFSVN